MPTAYTTSGVAGRKRRLSAARRNAWAGGMLYRDSLFDSVNPCLPGGSSCFAANESCVTCTLSWMLDWQSCEMSKPFDPLLLDMMMDALCSYHFTDIGVWDHVSSGLVGSFP